MKKIYKFLFLIPIFVLSFFLGFLRSFAAELPEGMYTANELFQGDFWYIYMDGVSHGVVDRDMYWTGHDTNSASYIDGVVNSAKIAGYLTSTNLVIPNIGTLSYTTFHWNNYLQDYNINYSTMVGALPFYYDCAFSSNIPIFRTQSDYNGYMNGSLSIEDALNYNKVLDNGNWVGTHNDVIYDNSVPIPQFKQANFGGFELESVPLAPDGIHNYLYEVQIAYGYENESEFLYDSTKYGDYVNQTTRPTPSSNNSSYVNLGYVTESVYGSTTSFPLSNWNVNVISPLWSWVDLHYEYSPSASSYPVGSQLKAYNLFYKPWGASSVYTNVNSLIQSFSHSEEAGLHNTPCTWVKYTVNFIYQDPDRGIVTGRPSTIYVWGNDQYRNINYSYGQDNALIQDNLQNGLINNDGGLYGGSYGQNFDFNMNDTGTFFNYLLSVFNGVDNSFTTFASIFSSVFACLPDFVVWTIFAGIMIMIIIGIVKTIVG